MGGNGGGQGGVGGLGGNGGGEGGKGGGAGGRPGGGLGPGAPLNIDPAGMRPQPRLWQEAKFFRFGMTLSSAPSSTPIHVPMAFQTDSYEVVGIIARLSRSSEAAEMSVGYCPRIWPPLTAPPMTKLTPPQPWSVPAPLAEIDRPNSEPIVTVTARWQAPSRVESY